MYDLNADPGSSTDRDLRPEYLSRARAVLASDWMAEYVAARTRAVEQELTQVAEANRRRAVAAEQRVAELEAAVLALADAWDDPDPERGDPDRADELRALVSDPTRRDRR